MLVHGCILTSSSCFCFWFFLKEPYWLAHHQDFGTFAHSPNGSTSCKIETNVLPYIWPFSVHIHDESWTLGKPCEIHLTCYGEHLRNNLRNLWTSHECMMSLLNWLHETFISSHHFWPGLMAGAETMVQRLQQLPWACLSKGLRFEFSWSKCCKTQS